MIQSALRQEILMLCLVALGSSLTACELKSPHVEPGSADTGGAFSDGMAGQDVAGSADAPDGWMWRQDCSNNQDVVEGYCEEKCAKDPAFGYCATYKTSLCAGCVAVSEEMCAKSSECAYSGRCAIYGDPPFCAPTGTANCTASAGCKEHGYCEFIEKCGPHPITQARIAKPSCVESSSWCKEHPEFGGVQFKILGKNGCIFAAFCSKPATSDADCKPACTLWGACKAKDGNCVEE